MTAGMMAYISHNTYEIKTVLGKRPQKLPLPLYHVYQGAMSLTSDEWCTYSNSLIMCEAYEDFFTLLASPQRLCFWGHLLVFMITQKSLLYEMFYVGRD